MHEEVVFEFSLRSHSLQIANINSRVRRALKTGLLAGVLAASASAIGQSGSVVSDAQIEANVLRALATAPELASEAITTKTVYGTVTLTGSVQSEGLRLRAETLASNAAGVRKVIDQLALAVDQEHSAGTPNPGPAMVLQSDGSYAPDSSVAQTSADSSTSPQRNNPDADQELDRQIEAHAAEKQGSSRMNQRQPSAASDGQYSMGGPAYPPYPSYSQRSNYGSHGYAPPMDGGQVAGQAVTVPNGTLIRLRVNQNLSSDHSQPGSAFDGIVVNDIVAGGFIAIPRGTAIQGTVVDAKPSGTLKGRGEMSLQLNNVTLAGKRYAIVSDTWSHNGGDKTIETVNKTVGFGAIGALIGAVAGGGVGAAVGGGVGAAAGIGSSAASGRGQVFVPSEAVVTFHLAAPAQLETVSEQEMQRLAYGVAAGSDQRYARRIYPRPYPYYAPYPPYPHY